jgi:hypothetical protein
VNRGRALPRLVAGLAAFVMASCGGDPDESAPTPETPAVETGAAATAAEQYSADDRLAAVAICEPLWNWITGIGDRFNETSRAFKDVPEGAPRQDAILAMLDDMAMSGSDLVGSLRTLDGTLTQRLVDDVATGMAGSLAEIDDIRTLVLDTPELDTDRPQLRLSQVIVRIEKVIDLPKPSLAAYSDVALTDLFIETRACQHAVKDANDGRQQYNG